MEKNNLPMVVQSKNVVQRFNEVLGANSAGFISSLMTLWRNNEKLQMCDSNSILGAAGQAAILKLSILPQMGYAYVIPYYDGKAKKYVATFQIGYKGLIQLAMRSGQYSRLNATEVYEGEIRGRNVITGELETGERTGDEIIGYVAYMELVNGFNKTLYMTRAEIEDHAKRYSDSYRADVEKNQSRSIWSKNFSAMARKTVLKKLLTTYAVMSVEMQNTSLAVALQADQSVITKEKFRYIDNGDAEVLREVPTEKIDEETGEIMTVETEPDEDNEDEI